MSKSKWKNSFLKTSIIKNINNFKKNKIWSRASVILPQFINRYMQVHTGKEFKKILITNEKIGYKFGQFCNTRIFRPKPKKENKRNAKKK